MNLLVRHSPQTKTEYFMLSVCRGYTFFIAYNIFVVFHLIEGIKTYFKHYFILVLDIITTFKSLMHGILFSGHFQIKLLQPLDGVIIQTTLAVWIHFCVLCLCNESHSHYSLILKIVEMRYLFC